jgi:hypothetical protein
LNVVFAWLSTTTEPSSDSTSTPEYPGIGISAKTGIDVLTVEGNAGSPVAFVLPVFKTSGVGDAFGSE